MPGEPTGIARRDVDGQHAGPIRQDVGRQTLRRRRQERSVEMDLSVLDPLAGLGQDQPAADRPGRQGSRQRAMGAIDTHPPRQATIGRASTRHKV